MYRLAAIEVQGFKAFADWSRLELRPLTLLYGRNNAGKSSILRLLALLADSVADAARSALECSGPAGRGAVFRALAWYGGGDRIRSSFRFRLHWSRDGVLTEVDEFMLDWSDERSVAYVRELHLRDADGALRLSARAQTDSSDVYIIGSGSGPGPDEHLTIPWAGLQPETDHPELSALRERLVCLRRSVIWLDSNRPRPPRLTPGRGAPPSHLDHHGTNALEFLAASRTLESSVARWFEAPPIARRLRLEPIGDFVQPKLGRLDDLAEFHLLDTGEGMAHVLPVLVAAELGAQASGLRVVAIEEPESHLHGDAQRALIRHLAQLAAADDPPMFVLETHSRVVLLSLQLAVAEGIITPGRCGVAWCEQRATGASFLAQIDLTRAGELRGWPRMALGDESELVRELLDRQDDLREVSTSQAKGNGED